MISRRIHWLVVALGVSACSAPPADSRYVQTALPDPASFPPVAQLLTFRCGTVDCHGSALRNLRLYGSSGLRLSAGDRPFVPVCDTQAEIDQDYQSVAGLEPATMSAVVADHGSSPERLTMVRKARGTESHKGGPIWAQGDASDVCLTSWLAGQTSTMSCATALASALPTGASDPLSQCITP